MLSRRDWAVAGTAVAVTVAATALLDRLAAGDRAPREPDVRGSPRDVEATPPGPDLRTREEALALRERRLAQAEQDLAAREAVVAAAERQAVADAAGGPAGEPSTTAEPLSEEERAHREILDAAGQLAAALGMISQLERARVDGGNVEVTAVTPEEQAQLLAATSELMASYTRLVANRERITGDLGAEVTTQLLDGLLPEGVKLSDPQRASVRRLYRDSERRLDSLGVPRHRLLPFLQGPLADPNAGLETWQTEGMQEIYRDAGTSMEEILTPGQKEHLDLDLTMQIGSGPESGPAQ